MAEAGSAARIGAARRADGVVSVWTFGAGAHEVRCPAEAHAEYGEGADAVVDRSAGAARAAVCSAAAEELAAVLEADAAGALAVVLTRRPGVDRADRTVASRDV